jgi:para-aminobenzoate synthetase/4-amino-4-deoxychorismate lyase
VRVLFEFENKPLLFDHPRQLISCHDPEALRLCFNAVERAIADGYYVAGYLSYEAGYAFEPAFGHLKGNSFPLMWMGVFDHPRRERPRVQPGPFRVSDLVPGLTQDV